MVFHGTDHIIDHGADLGQMDARDVEGAVPYKNTGQNTPSVLRADGDEIRPRRTVIVVFQSNRFSHRSIHAVPSDLLVGATLSVARHQNIINKKRMEILLFPYLHFAAHHLSRKESVIDMDLDS